MAHPINLEKTLKKTEIAKDYEVFINFIEQTHPDLTYTVDVNEYERVKNLLRIDKDSASLRDIWYSFSKLNPLFNDAHLGLMIPESVNDQYLQQLSVTVVNNSAYLNVANDKVYEVLNIGSHKVETLIKRMRGHVRGESQELQNFVLEKRFFSYLDMFEVDYLNSPWGLSRRGQANVVTNFEKLINDFSKLDDNINPFQYSTIDNEIGILKIDSFDKKFYNLFETYLRRSFQDIVSKNIDQLIIDISNNGGGARELTDLLLSYLTENKYSPTSKVTARITDQNISRIPHAKLGDTITLPFEQWKKPENNTVFKGDIYVVISERTYSQAIVFSNIIQDFNIAKLVGKETGGKSNQTGQVQTVVLPNSKFKVISPIYIFYSYGNPNSRKGVIPDIELETSSLTDLINLISKK